MANEDGGGGALPRRCPLSDTTEEGRSWVLGDGARLRGRRICLWLVRFGPPQPDLVESAKIGSAPASTRAASHRAATEDGCGGARAVACLGIDNFTSTVVAGLGVYDDGQIKIVVAINGVTVWQLVDNGSTTKFRRR